MSYQNMLEKIAKQHNTTAEEVDAEIRNAITATGLDIEPSVFIALVTGKAKNELNNISSWLFQEDKSIYSLISIIFSLINTDYSYTIFYC